MGLRRRAHVRPVASLRQPRCISGLREHGAFPGYGRDSGCGLQPLWTYGNYLPEFSSSYFSDREPTDWGAAINFDGLDSGPVREFCTANAGYWIEEFHLDGLRLDATQDIHDCSNHDSSKEHILRAVAGEVRRKAE